LGSQRRITPSSSRTTSRPVLRPMKVRAEGEREQIGEIQSIPILDKKQQNSYERIEAPVRGGEGAPGNIPDGGPPVGERNNLLDNLLIQNDQAEEKRFLGTEVAFPDAMRFKGAAPEVINGRLAMLGFVAALPAELRTGTPVWEQITKAPGPIAATFLLFIVASLIPILKGVPRKGGKEWGGIPWFTPDREIINGRVAMLGFVGLIAADYFMGKGFGQ